MQNHLQEFDPIRHMSAKELPDLYEVGSSKIVAADPKMRQVIEMASVAARFDTTVLLLGESGVGKGVVARFIHDSSERRGGAFVKINCGAIPLSLVESELFGYKKGAFTGAGSTGKIGLIEMAEGGTLFLDEIGELPLSAQVKLLRVLEDRHITPVGDVLSREVDVRIIAATNRNLKEMISKGTFREDLFFRLNVVPILIPPLRERRDDLPVLLNHFLIRLNERFKTNKKINTEAIDILCAYSFPGNVRELENLVERLIVLCAGDEIQPDHLPHHGLNRELLLDPLNLIEQGMTLPEVIGRMEEQVIKRALSKYGSKRKAAKALGVNPSTIVRKTRRHSLSSSGAIMH
jgi:transcriptional regulator with PAS, ATPase and Fis domain